MIIVSPDQLQQAAAKLMACAVHIQDDLQAADSALRGIDWSGLAREQFTGEYDAARMELQGQCEGLAWIARTLSEIAGRFGAEDHVAVDAGMQVQAARERFNVHASTVLGRAGGQQEFHVRLDGGPLPA